MIVRLPRLHPAVDASRAQTENFAAASPDMFSDIRATCWTGTASMALSSRRFTAGDARTAARTQVTSSARKN